MTLQTSGHRRARRDLARELAAEYQVPYPLAFAAVRAGVHQRCVDLVDELGAETPAQRSAAFTAAIETLTARPHTLDMDYRPLTHRLQPAVAPASVIRSKGVTP